MKNSRLLIIDDDPDVSQTLQTLAESTGFEVITTGSDISFSAQLALFEPDVIIVDLAMPDRDGLQLIEQLADLNNKAQLVLVSNLDHEALDAVAQSATNKGMRMLGILQKPAPVGQIRQLLTLYLSANKRKAPVRNNWQQQLGNKDWMPTQDDLIDVIENDLLTLNYQPKLDCATGSLIGFEALARWEIPGKGTVTPDVFVPLAENSHLMSTLTCNIAQRGLRWLADIQKSPILSNCNLRPEFAPDKLTLALNLSIRCLEDPDMPDKLEEICTTVGIDPGSVVLEIGEASVMHDPDALLVPLQRFRQKRFQLSIDDFGTAFSSMLHLVRMPFTELKIDKDFVGQADTSDEAREVIKCIIDLATSLGLRSVAEGVESAKTRDYLRDCGCDAFQGYLVSRPVNEDQLLDWSKAYCDSLPQVAH